MEEVLVVHKKMQRASYSICGAYHIPYQRIFHKDAWKPLTFQWKRVNCERCLGMIKEPIVRVMWRTWHLPR